MITQDLKKSCKLAYQRKKLVKEKKKLVKDKNEKGLKRNLKMDEIQEVKNTKLTERKPLNESIINKAMASHTDLSHAVKAWAFAKTLIEKEKTLNDLIMVQGKLEDECKAL